MSDAKRVKLDGDLSRVSKSILDQSQDFDKWIEERRKNWPTKDRIKSTPLRPEPNPVTPEAPQRSQGTSNQQRRVCRFFLKGTCKSGANCRFSHDSLQQHSKVYKRFEPAPKGSLFVKMVQRDLDQEDDQLLDFICYLNETHRLS